MDNKVIITTPLLAIDVIDKHGNSFNKEQANTLVSAIEKGVTRVFIGFEPTSYANDESDFHDTVGFIINPKIIDNYLYVNLVFMQTTKARLIIGLIKHAKLVLRPLVAVNYDISIYSAHIIDLAQDVYHDMPYMQYPIPNN